LGNCSKIGIEIREEISVLGPKNVFSEIPSGRGYDGKSHTSCTYSPLKTHRRNRALLPREQFLSLSLSNQSIRKALHPMLSLSLCSSLFLSDP